MSLDVSSRTSVALTKIIFREFLGIEPEWKDAEPEIESMLVDSDAALLIGDPALQLSVDSALGIPHSALRTFDLAELWHAHTGLGFVFAMWMTRRENVSIDFAAARDEGLAHIDEIVANYQSDIHLGPGEMRDYLSNNISYSIDPAMEQGMELYFKLAAKHKLIDRNRPLKFI